MKLFHYNSLTCQILYSCIIYTIIAVLKTKTNNTKKDKLESFKKVYIFS